MYVCSLAVGAGGGWVVELLALQAACAAPARFPSLVPVLAVALSGDIAQFHPAPLLGCPFWPSLAGGPAALLAECP